MCHDCARHLRLLSPSAAPMSTLLDMPAVVLGQIAQGLTSKERLRLHLLVCKSLSVGGAFEKSFWSRAIMGHLERFMPASLYYDGPDNCSNETLKGLTGRDRFPDQAAECDARLVEALQAAGAAGVTWTGEWYSYSLFSYNTAAHVVLPPDLAREIEDRSLTHVHYARFARGLACESCGEDAQRQCAGCGELQCLSCCVRCSEEKPRADTRAPYTIGPDGRLVWPTIQTTCPFVLCEACHESFSLTGDRVHRDDVYFMEEPGFSLGICTSCPPNTLFCPAHIDCCINECNGCDDSRCAKHATDDPIMVSCSECYWTICVDCCSWPRGEEKRVLRYCVSCGYTPYCTLCCPSGTCPTCRSYLDY